jgi:hypothetical protein
MYRRIIFTICRVDITGYATTTSIDTGGYGTVTDTGTGLIGIGTRRGGHMAMVTGHMAMVTGHMAMCDTRGGSVAPDKIVTRGAVA